MGTVIIIVLGVLTYANPILLLATFIKRLTQRESEEGRGRLLFWVALASAIAAVIVLWASTAFAPTATRHDDVIYRRMLKASVLMAAAALLAVIWAKGKERKWVAVSALITPLSWF